jgi:hypothetical protein
MAVLALSAVIVPGPSQAFQPARDSVLATKCRQRQAIGHARGLELCGPRAGSGVPAGAHQGFCREFGPGFGFGHKLSAPPSRIELVF